MATNIELEIARLHSKKADGVPIAALTAYDYPTARLLEECDIDFILVGDSLGMVILGYPDTTHVSMGDMLHHLRAVVRGVLNTLIIADMPFGSYPDPATALANAQRFTQCGASAVKLEGGQAIEHQVKALVKSGIPVMGHIGMLPQSVVKEGGYSRKGTTPEGKLQLLADAKLLEAAGAFAVVIELVQAEVASEISTALRIPTIGIGSGSLCDGQILVTHDLIGLFPWFRPKFARPEADIAGEIKRAVQQFIHRTHHPIEQKSAKNN